METWQENIWESSIYFPKYIISVSQSIVGTIGELDSIRKITLYFISQGYRVIFCSIFPFYVIVDLSHIYIYSSFREMLRKMSSTRPNILREFPHLLK